MSAPRITVLEPYPARFTLPEIAETFAASRESANIVHDLVGGGVGISLLRAAPRAGTLTLYYPDRDAAYAAFNLLSERAAFTFDEDYLAPETLPSFMLFAVVGRGATIRLDTETGTRWLVDVEFQELDQ